VFVCLCKTAEEPDTLAVHYARSYGVVLLTASVPWFLLRDTRDATVHITLMMSCVVVSVHLYFSLLRYTTINYLWSEIWKYWFLLGGSRQIQ